MILELCYMLHMIGVPLDVLLGDDMSVVINTILLSSVLQKKDCEIGYHCVRENVTDGIL